MTLYQVVSFNEDTRTKEYYETCLSLDEVKSIILFYESLFVDVFTYDTITIN